MKRLLFVFALMLFALPALAADFTLQWDNPTNQAWDNVEIYQVSGTNYTLKATVAGNIKTATITGYGPGSYQFVAQSVMNGAKSDYSNTATGTIKPDTPSNFRLAFEIEIDENGNVHFRIIDDPTGFFRAS